jgi:hypothetical protein
MGKVQRWVLRVQAETVDAWERAASWLLACRLHGHVLMLELDTRRDCY